MNLEYESTRNLGTDPHNLALNQGDQVGHIKQSIKYFSENQRIPIHEKNVEGRDFDNIYVLGSTSHQ